MLEIEVRPMRPEERRAAAGVAARGMRDNPIHVATFGDDPDRRVATLERLFGALFAVLPTPPRVAVRAGHVVGVCGASPPGRCALPAPALARIAAALARSGVGPLARALRWLEAWGARDPRTPHWHVGPVAVEGGLQGLGIGSRLLADLTATLDAQEVFAWLETDKAENVVFYRRAGFEVAEEAEVLGVRCWFMARRPAATPGPRGGGGTAPARELT
ncbi:MAG TPA: GNAT family N-acetyltransferase [Myxococcota bacterium]